MINNKGFWIVWGLFVASFILDFASTIRAKANLELLETNPLFQATGSLLVPVMINIGLMIFLVWAYPRCNETTRFIIINSMVAVILLRFILIVPNNFASVDMAANMTTEQIKAIATPQAIKMTQYLVAFDLYMPFVTGLLAMVFYRMDHLIIKKQWRVTRWKKKSILRYGKEQ